MVSRKGFGLVELMVGLGLLGASGYGLMKVIETNNKVKKTNDYRIETKEVVNRVQKILTHPEACRLTFLNLNATNAGITVIRNQNNEVVQGLNQPFGITGATVISMALNDQGGTEDGVRVNPGQAGSTNLVFTFAPKSGTSYSTKQVQEKLKIWIITNAASQIQTCYSQTTGEGSAWKREPTNPNNIYYNEGNIGVGTSIPNAPLTVNGSIQGTNPAGERFTITPDPSQYLIFSFANKPIKFWNQAMGRMADVTAGNIRVDTVVTLGTAVEACDGSKQGAMRYDPAIRRVRICEGGIWKIKAVAEWCTPPGEIKKGDDEWMTFHQADTARRVRGAPCEPAQRNKSKNAKIDSTGFSIRYDDKSKSCRNDQNCQDFRASEQ